MYSCKRVEPSSEVALSPGWLGDLTIVWEPYYEATLGSKQTFAYVIFDTVQF